MFKDLDKRVKNFDTLDIGLIKWAAIVAGVIIIKIFPGLLNINWLLLVVILIALAARPVYKFWNYSKPAAGEKL